MFFEPHFKDTVSGYEMEMVEAGRIERTTYPRPIGYTNYYIPQNIIDAFHGVRTIRTKQNAVLNVSKEDEMPIEEKNTDIDDSKKTVSEFDYLGALMSVLKNAIKQKMIPIATERKNLKEGDFGFIEGFLFLDPERTFLWLQANVEGEKIPVRRFETFLHRNGLLQKESLSEKRYRYRVQIGGKRVRYWALRPERLDFQSE